MPGSLPGWMILFNAWRQLFPDVRGQVGSPELLVAVGVCPVGAQDGDRGTSDRSRSRASSGIVEACAGGHRKATSDPYHFSCRMTIARGSSSSRVTGEARVRLVVLQPERRTRGLCSSTRS